MNKVILLGRLVKDVDVHYTDSGKVTGSFTVAVDRPKMKGQDKAEADFIKCVAWGKTAETIGNYFSKGSRILVEGVIRTGSYKNKNGDTVYTTEVWVNNFEFVESKKSGNYSRSSMSGMGEDVGVDF